MTPDPTALWAARFEVRTAFVAIKRLRADPVLTELLDRLDELACGLTAQIDALNPTLPMVISHADRA